MWLCVYHLLIGELDAGLAHGDHQHAVVEVLLLGNVHGTGGGLFET
jgi:hypothetical protein